MVPEASRMVRVWPVPTSAVSAAAAPLLSVTVTAASLFTDLIWDTRDFTGVPRVKPER